MSVSTGYTRATLPAQIFPKTNQAVKKARLDLYHAKNWGESIFCGGMIGFSFGVFGILFILAPSFTIFLTGLLSSLSGGLLLGAGIGGIIASHQFKKIAPLKANVDVDNNDLNHMEIANLLNYEESALSIDDFIKDYGLNKT